MNFGRLNTGNVVKIVVHNHSTVNKMVYIGIVEHSDEEKVFLDIGMSFIGIEKNTIFNVVVLGHREDSELLSTLAELVDSATPIIELFKPMVQSQITWKKEWIDKATRSVKRYLRIK